MRLVSSPPGAAYSRDTEPVTTVSSTTRVGWWRLLLAAIAAALVTLLGAGTASATTLPNLETRVGASTPTTVVVVGVHESVSAGHRWGNAPPQAGMVVATGVAANGAARTSSVVDDVLAETAGATQRNLTSSYTLSADEALTAGQRWVGEGYTELGKPGSGVFRSADGLRQFRMDSNSLMGNHAPGVPHVHLETYAPGARVPTVNNHIPFRD